MVIQTWARQTRAAAALLFRYLARRAVRGGAGPSHTKTRAPWFILLSSVWAFYVGNLLWTRFADAATKPLAEGPPAMAWQLVGIVLALVGLGLVELAPELGRIRPPLRIALLEELPFTTAARLFLVWFRNPFVPGLTIVGALAWTQMHAPLATALMALGLYLAATTLGYALGSVVRVVFSGRGRRAISIGSLVLVLVGVQLLVFSERFHHLLMPPSFVVDAALEVRAASLGTLTLVGFTTWVVGLLVIAACEKKGYDRLDALPEGIKRSRRVDLDAYATERLLTGREGGIGLAIVGWLFLGAVVVGTVFAMMKAPDRDIVQKLVMGVAVAVAYLGAVIALSRAGQAVRRDAGARTFLAPLPITPFDTLQGKVQAVRFVVLPLMLTAIPGLVLALWHATYLGPIALEVGWRSLAAVTVVWIGADTAVSIAFLTGGVGLPGMKNMGAPTSFSVQILMLPLIAAAIAPHPLIALSSIAAVFAVGMEARRAAHLAVRWQDDAADDLERDTSVWRALLALATFYAAQTLGTQLLSLGDLSEALHGAFGYGSSAIVLLVLTMQGRRDLPKLRWWPSSPTWLALGVVLGAASGLAALAFAKLLQELGVDVAGKAVSGVDAVVSFVVFTVVAAVVEEMFFRGWLQSAIVKDLPARLHRWAPFIAALAFALAHVGGPIVPQLVLGVFAGVLYARTGSLMPGILAHATHNAVALLLGSQ